MITLTRVPKADSVFLSSNPLTIELNSDNGANHYFRANISVDGVSFTTQLWGRITETGTQVSLRYLFDHLFIQEFQEVTTTSFLNRPEIQKKISITVEEVNVVTEATIESVALPEFYVLKSYIEQDFNHTLVIQKLSIVPDQINVSKESLVIVPFWILGPAINITVLDGSTEVFNEDYSNLIKGAYTFSFDLSSVTLSSTGLVIKITAGSSNIIQNITVINTQSYDVERLYFKNNFDLFEYVEFFGKRDVNDSYKRKTVERFDNIEKQVSISENLVVKIDTGFLLSDESSIVTAVNKSDQIYYYINNEFLPFIPTSTKNQGNNSDEDYFSEVIQIKQNQKPLKNDLFNYD